MGGGASLFDLASKYGLSLEQQLYYKSFHAELVKKGLSEEEIHRTIIEKLENDKKEKSDNGDDHTKTASEVRKERATFSHQEKEKTQTQSQPSRPHHGGGSSGKNASNNTNNSIRSKGLSKPLSASRGNSANRRPSTIVHTEHRCELCNISFIDDELLEKHFNISSLHAKNLAEKQASQAATNATTNTVNSGSYQTAVDIIRLQNEVSRTSQLLQAYFIGQHNAPVHSLGDHSKVLMRAVRQLDANNKSVTMVNFTLYLLDDEATVTNCPTQCPVFEIYATQQDTPIEMARCYLSYNAMMNLLQQEIRNSHDDAKDSIVRKGGATGMQLNAAIERKIILDIVVSYISNHVHFQQEKGGDTKTCQIILQHDSADVGNKLDHMLQKLMGAEAQQHHRHEKPLLTPHAAATVTDAFLGDERVEIKAETVEEVEARIAEERALLFGTPGDEDDEVMAQIKIYSQQTSRQNSARKDVTGATVSSGSAGDPTDSTNGNSSGSLATHGGKIQSAKKSNKFLMTSSDAENHHHHRHHKGIVASVLDDLEGNTNANSDSGAETTAR